MPPAPNDPAILLDRTQLSPADRRLTRPFIPAETTPQFSQYQHPPPPPPLASQNNMQQPPPSHNNTAMLESQYPHKNVRVPSQTNTNVQASQGGNARINPNRFYDRSSQRDDNSDSFSGFQSGRNNNNRHNWNNRGRNNNNNNNSRNSFGSNNDGGNRTSSVDRGNNNNSFQSRNNFRRNDNDDCFQQQSQFSNNLGDSSRTDCKRDEPLDDEGNKTPEEIAFDEQFRKWEEQFMNWKRDNANHPDRKAYNDYESKMEECRSKLLQRRAEMRQRRATAISSKIVDQADLAPTQTVTKHEENENEMSQSDESQVATNAGSTVESKDQNIGVFVASNSESGIPGLDLVDESIGNENISNVAPPEANSNFSAINNILGDPNIKSLLSNIQKQQQDVAQTAINDPIISDQMQQQPASFFQNHNMFNQNRANPFNRVNQDAHPHEPQQFHGEGRPTPRNWNSKAQNLNQDGNQAGKGCAPFQSLMDLDIQNPFNSLQNQRDDFNQRQQQGFQTESDNDFNVDVGNGNGRNRKRNRRRSLRRDSQNLNQWQQNINNNNQDNTRSFGNDDFNDDDYTENNKRPRIPSSGNDSQSYSEDFYRPTTIIDYQNRSQPPSASIKSDHTKSAHEIDMDYFPRNIIEYNHKSKIHVLETLCPVTVIDYKHKPEGYVDEAPAVVKSRLFPWQRSQPMQRQGPPPKQKSILSRVPSLLQDLQGKTKQAPPPPKQSMRNNRNKYTASGMPESTKPPTFPCTRDSCDEAVTPIILAAPRQKRREHLVNIDDILLLPGRANRPKK